MGRPVNIKTRGGGVYEGIVTDVTHTHVFLRPTNHRNLGGFGYGFGGFGGGVGIALGTIVGLSLAPLFFW